MSLPPISPALIPLRRYAAPVEPYKAAIFFDNDPAKVAQVTKACPLIKGITVPETPGTSGPGRSSKSLIVKYSDEPLKSIISESGGDDNIYIKTARSHGQDDEHFDPVSGISSEHVEQLNIWLAETASQTPRAVIFDWDRTITKVEGVLLPSKHNPRSPISTMLLTVGLIGIKTDKDLIESMLQIICGAPARLAMLRGMFNTIKDSGADVIILTNNDSCFTTSYKELVNGLIPNPGPPVFLACSKNPPFFGDKGRRLIVLPVFKSLCASAPAEGGGGAGGGVPVASAIPFRTATVPVRHGTAVPVSRSSSPSRTRRFVNVSGNNENENLYKGGRRLLRRSRVRRVRMARRKTHRGKDRKN